MAVSHTATSIGILRALTHPFGYREGVVASRSCYQRSRPKEDTMAKTVSAETRHDLLQVIRERYGVGAKDEPVEFSMSLSR
jgi:hypothetical protein